jgi:hypothetical protein
MASNFPNLTSIVNQENATLAQAQPVVAKIQAASDISNGEPVSLFALDHVANAYVPASASQKNGSAPWVDTSRDLISMGVNPATDSISLAVWVQARQNYYDVGLILKMLSFNPAVTIELVLA